MLNASQALLPTLVPILTYTVVAELEPIPAALFQRVQTIAAAILIPMVLK